MNKKLLPVMCVCLLLITGLLLYHFVVIPTHLYFKKLTIEKYSDCITEGVSQRVYDDKIINWIGSNEDQLEDMKVCYMCMEKLNIAETREMLEVCDYVRGKYYNF